MKAIRSATAQSSNTTQTITFLDRVLTLRIIWNEVSGSFFLTIEDGLGGRVEGIRIVEDYPILANNKGFIDFAGDILVIKEDESAGDELTYQNFGNGWNPYLVTPEEVEAWRAENGLE